MTKKFPGATLKLVRVKGGSALEWKITCKTCDNHCAITVNGRGEQIDLIEGNRCKKGEIYATNAYSRWWREEHPDEEGG